MTKVSCPSCAARYNVPVEKLGKRVKCAKCGERFELSPPAEDDFAFELEGLPTGEAVVRLPLPPAPTDAPGPAHAGSRTDRHDFVGVGAIGAYMTDVLGFFKILAQPWELMTLVAVCLLCVFQVVAGAFLCMGIIVQLIITGWYLSFLLKVVQSGAARDDGLPDFSLSDGVWEDIVIPCMSFLSVRLLVILPMIVALIFAMNNGGLEPELAWAVGFLGVAMPELALVVSFQLAEEFPRLLTIVVPALLLGLAAAPMLVLVVAVGGIPALSRVDLMARTIAQTLPGYALATLIYIGSLGAAVGVAYAAAEAFAADSSQPSAPPKPAVRPVNPPVASTPPAATPGAASTGAPLDPNAAADPNAAVGAPAAPPPAGLSARDVEREVLGTLGGQIVGTIVSVIASVFAMRAIGLYYAHFKKNFAWSWG